MPPWAPSPALPPAVCLLTPARPLARGGINEWRSTLVRLRQLEGGARLERCRPHTPTLAHPHSRQFEEGQRLSAAASSSRAAASSGNGTPISDGQEAGEGMPMLPFGSSLASDRG